MTKTVHHFGEWPESGTVSLGDGCCLRCGASYVTLLALYGEVIVGSGLDIATCEPAIKPLVADRF